MRQLLIILCLFSNLSANIVVESIKLFDTNPSLNEKVLSAKYNEAIKAAEKDLLPYLEYSYARMRLAKGSDAEMKKIAPDMKKNADGGNVNAQNRYALMLLNGHGVTKDYVQARHYYKQAAAKGDIDAQYNYGVMLLDGEGGSKDTQEALAYFKLAAENGHAIARFNYANILYTERKNLDLARANFKKSADQGFVNAQNTYALMSYVGEGGAKNLTEARDYFKRAAEQGHPTAQYNYAVMCYKGEGGDIDFGAAKFFIKEVIKRDSSNKDAIELAKDLSYIGD